MSGVGFGTVLPEMWPLAAASWRCYHGDARGSRDAIKVMVENNRVVAEGAGAISVAAALSGRYEYSRVCAVVSGGNIDSAALSTILQGGVPE